MTGSLRVVGLDLSLTSTGMADGDTVHAVQTTQDDGVTEYRLDFVASAVRNYVLGQPFRAASAVPRADLVVVEGAAFNEKGNAVDQLAGLRWIVRRELWQVGVPFAVVAPSTLKAYTTGNGRATKQQMVEALIDRHSAALKLYRVKDGRYDMADALGLAAMGYAFIGQPLPTQGPPPRMDALLAPAWPAWAHARRAGFDSSVL